MPPEIEDGYDTDLVAFMADAWIPPVRGGSEEAEPESQPDTAPARSDWTDGDYAIPGELAPPPPQRGPDDETHPVNEPKPIGLPSPQQYEAVANALFGPNRYA
jgi:hypothetical protein